MKKRMLALVLVLALLLAQIPVMFIAGAADTDSTPISTWAQFASFLAEADSAQAKSYTLTADIAFEGDALIGGYIASNIVLEGNGHTIRGLQLEDALFEAMYESSIRNVTFENATVTSAGADRMAMLTKETDPVSYVTNCVFTDCTLTLPNDCAGLTAGVVAAENGGVLTGCVVADTTITHADATCTGTPVLGGIAGENATDGVIVNAISKVAFDLGEGATCTAGGIVGTNRSLVEYCYANVNAPSAIDGNTSGRGEVLHSLYKAGETYTLENAVLNKDYRAMSVAEIAADMTETVQSNYNQDLYTVSTEDLAAPWSVENGDLTLSFDGKTAYVYVYADDTLTDATLSFSGESQSVAVGQGKKFAVPVGYFQNGKYVRNSVTITYNTERYQMVNNFVYKCNASYVKKLPNTVDNLAQNYTDMYLAPTAKVVAGTNGKADYVVNTATGKIYPFATTLSLSNLTVKDELVALRFDGEGTAVSPFQIKNGYDMQTLSFYVASGTKWNDLSYNEAHYIVVNDIDLTGFSFDSIGTNGQANKYAFRGVFDGQGHTISGYTLKTTRSQQGLFGVVVGYAPDVGGRQAVIQNVNLREVGVVNDKNEAGNLRGALIGQAEYAHISGCTVDNVNTHVEGGTQIGGLIGYAYSCEITNCGASSPVHTYSGVAYAGGLVGNVAHSRLENCYVNTSFTNENVTDPKFLSIGPIAGHILDTELRNIFYTYRSTTELHTVIPGTTVIQIDTMRTADFAADLTVYAQQNGMGAVWMAQNSGTGLPVTQPVGGGENKYLARSRGADIGVLTLSGNVTQDTYLFGTRVQVTLSSGTAPLSGIRITDMNGVALDIPVTTDEIGKSYSFSMPQCSVQIYPLFEDDCLVGSGTSADPYQIGTYDDLVYMGSYVTAGAKDINGKDYSDAAYQMTADIDAKGQEFAGMGKGASPFCGSFDGNNHTIRNMVLTGNGLFETVDGGVTIEDLALDNITMGRSALLIGTAGTTKVGAVYLQDILVTNSRFDSSSSTGLIKSVYSGIHTVYMENILMENITYAGTAYGILAGELYSDQLRMNTVVLKDAGTGPLVGYKASPNQSIENLYTYDTILQSSYIHNGFKDIPATTLYAYDLSDISLISELSGNRETMFGEDASPWCARESDGRLTLAEFEGKPGVYPITYESVLTTGALSLIDMSTAPRSVQAGENVELLYNTTMYTGSLTLTNRNGNTIWHTYEEPEADSAMGKITFVMPNFTVYVKNNGQAVQYAGLSGAGTVSSPYLIYTPAQLKFVADVINGTIDKAAVDHTTDYSSAYFRLGADLDMTGVDWPGIGMNGTAFVGQLDGNGHTIANLNIDSGRDDGNRQGLFAIIGKDGVVKNMTIKNANIWSESTPVRGAATVAKQNDGTISRVMVVDSTIQLGHWDNLGGIAGKNNGIIEYCGVVNTLLRYRWGGTGNHIIGGLTAVNNGQVRYCYTYDCTIANGNPDSHPLCGAGTPPVYSAYNTEMKPAQDVWSRIIQPQDKAMFEKGDVTYFTLNGGNTNNPVWRQNLDEGVADAYPVPFSDHNIVYYYINSSGVEQRTNIPKITMGVTLLRGDANTNGQVDKQDTIQLENYLAGKGSLSANELHACDVNSDGRVDKQDLALLRAYLNNGALAGANRIGKLMEVDAKLPDDGVLLGDVNRDGKVDKTDLGLIRDYLDGKHTLPDSALLAANVDLSDGFDASDLAVIRQYLDDLAAGRIGTGHVGRYVYAGAIEKQSQGDPTNPSTGDTGGFVPTAVILLLSGGVLIGSTALRKKRK